MENVNLFLLELEKEYSKLFEEYNLAEWVAQNSGEKKDFDKLHVIKLKRNKFFSDNNIFNKLKEYKNLDVEDEFVKRQLILLYNEFLSFQGSSQLLDEISVLETDVGMVFNDYRGVINGRKFSDNELKKILKTSVNEQELKDAWEANKRQGELVERKLIELIKLRNKLAQNLGYKNYYEFGLKIQEQEPDEIKKLVDEIAIKGDFVWDETKSKIDDFLSEKFGINKDELKPWHYQDFFFQDPIQINKIDLDKYYDNDVLKMGKDFFEGINLPVDEILKNSDLYERSGKCQHAFAMDLNKCGDVRTLNNLKNNEQWIGTLLHELGHCVYWKYMDFNIPYFLRDTAHTFVTEAIAMFFGRLSHDVSFIEHVYRPLDDDVKEKIDESFKIAMQIATRWMIVMIEFEREMYEDSNQNLNELWWLKVKKYQGINFSRDKPDWASKIHFVIAPVYYHNYLLGEVLASQIYYALKKDEDSLVYVNNRDIGTFLKSKIFDEGQKKYWNHLLKDAIGEELTTKYFETQFFK